MSTTSDNNNNNTPIAITGGHHWASTLLSKPTWCQQCTSYIWIPQATECTSCGLTVHTDCLPNVLYKCWSEQFHSTSESTTTSEETHHSHDLHHWLPGNIVASNRMCLVCSHEVGPFVLGGFEYMRCSRCHSIIHARCVNATSAIQLPNIKAIDSGHSNDATTTHQHHQHRHASDSSSATSASTSASSTSPISLLERLHLKRPSSVLSSSFSSSTTSAFKCHPHQAPLLMCSCLITPSPSNATISYSCSHPLIAFVNSRSGGGQGAAVIRRLLRYLAPEQIIDLASVEPRSALEKFQRVRNLRILVCGGDGTVCWVLHEMIDKSPALFSNALSLSSSNNDDLPPLPPVAVLPLGTANDTSRILNWGPGYVDRQNLLDTLLAVQHSNEILLDRWLVTFDPPMIDDKQRQVTTMGMLNYFSIGLDARIALKFHHTRNTSPQLFASRVGNKAWYALFGMQNFGSWAPDPLNDSGVTVDFDESPTIIPQEAQSLLVCNIQSYAGGTNPWGWGNSQVEPFVESRTDDCRLEAMCLFGVEHMVAMQTLKKGAHCLAQPHEVRVTCTNSMPMQVDGEPFEYCGSVSIRFNNKARMLRAPTDYVASE